MNRRRIDGGGAMTNSNGTQGSSNLAFAEASVLDDSFLREVAIEIQRSNTRLVGEGKLFGRHGHWW